MKKRTILLSMLLVATLLLGTAAAAGGDAGDPLISLDYLRNVFAPAAEAAAQEKLDASGKTVYDAAETKWRAAIAATEASLGSENAGSWAETRLKQGDVLSAPTGTQVLLLAGSAAAQFPSGAVVDVTDGTELVSGGVLQARHRYLVAEDTTALFTVASRTAVVGFCGGSYITASVSAPDYNAMAAALKTLSLFRGTDTGYGGGFDLETSPDRIQALVMLIRMLGEENAALECTSPIPFKDIPSTYWARPYIAYAYEKGYSNGVGADQFAPGRPANEDMYVEFVLRALGYSDTAQTDISDALDRAFSLGVLTGSERTLLRSNDFLRADVVYLSWYALDVPLPGGEFTLRDKLEAAGVFSEDAFRSASTLVTSERVY